LQLLPVSEATFSSIVCKETAFLYHLPVASTQHCGVYKCTAIQQYFIQFQGVQLISS